MTDSEVKTALRQGVQLGAAQPIKGNLGKVADKFERRIEVAQLQASHHEQVPLYEPIPYGIDIATVSRLGRQQMTIEQIAVYLQIPKPVFRDVLIRFPELRQAYEYGVISLIETATANIEKAVSSGDLRITQYLLERKGGWTPPPRDPPVIVIQGGQGVTIDGEHVEDLAAVQRQWRGEIDGEMS